MNLRDQLVKSGAVSKDAARKAAQEKRQKNAKQNKLSKKAKAELAVEQVQQQQQQVQQKRTQKIDMTKLDKEKRARKAQVLDILKVHRLNRDPKTADQRYHFNYNSKAYEIDVTAAQRNGILNQSFAIIVFEDQPNLVPIEVADKVKGFDGDVFTFICQKDEVDLNNTSDEYAGYEIPDDLMW
ncbi:DUF2058 family protein [Piscirickettsia salmonis]|uniref:DUF2058 family protein n=1 Tax=Piscirickettsia salmonis TaxID=1238 RepID=UPI000F08D48F|nr:DUF2058 domain-containing protein [Piscirickettsiaceae bacterium NZ-RLO2]